MRRVCCLLRGGAALAETLVNFDAATGALSLGTGNRYHAKQSAAEAEILAAITEAAANGAPLNTRQVRECTGHRAEVADAARVSLAAGHMIHSVARQAQGNSLDTW